MRIPGRRVAKRWVRWTLSRGRDRTVVLGYHRLGAQSHDYYDMEVSRETFLQHLRDIRDAGSVLRLSDVLRSLHAGRVERGVVVTFDDGYAENLEELVGIAAEHEMPVTVFLPSALLGREPWWDRLESTLEEASQLPGELVWQVGRGVYRRVLDRRERAEPSARGRLALDLHAELADLDDKVRDDALGALERWAGSNPSLAPKQIAAPERIRCLALSEWLDIGSHSVSHSRLANLSEEEQRSEVVKSRNDLESLVGRPVELFSFPNGSCSEVSVRLVREAGYLGACSSLPDVVTAGTDPCMLPRMWPKNQPDAVANILRTWL